jgi:hypothetical protein
LALFGSTILIPADLVFTGIVLAFVAAFCAASYSSYHRWNSRGRLTADQLYHRVRAELGLKALLIAGVFFFVLVLLLGLSR